MQLTSTDLLGVNLLRPKVHSDHRGFFSEIYSKRNFRKLGIEVNFVQDNRSVSTNAGTLRGLHFQAPPHDQAKLIRCIRGSIFDVAVDIRKGSPTFGKWFGCELTPENGIQMFIASGFAHGFLTLEDDSEVLYKCSGLYDQSSEGSILWNDEAIGIDWPLRTPVTISSKDSQAPRLAEITPPFDYEVRK